MPWLYTQQRKMRCTARLEPKRLMDQDPYYTLYTLIMPKHVKWDLIPFFDNKSH